jgi:hypothetical protein
MTEIYWITRLGLIFDIALACVILSGIATFAYNLWFFLDCDERPKKSGKVTRCLWITFITSLVLVIFIPNKKDLLLMYTVGNTIDFVEKNPTAQKIPDKIVDCLDKYLEEKNENDD